MGVIPGMDPGFYGIERPPIQLTYVNHSSVVSSGNISHPGSGIESGDLLIYIGLAMDTSGDPPSMSTPGGYSSLVTGSATPGGTSGYRVIAARKVADGTEDGSGINVSSSGGTEGEAAIIVQFRPNIPIGTVTLVASDIEITTNNPASQTQGGTGIEANLHVALYSGSVAVTSRSYTPTEDMEVTLTTEGITNNYVKWKTFFPTDAAEAVVVDMADFGNNVLMSFTLLCEAA
jgi:hypothetical protein